MSAPATVTEYACLTCQCARDMDEAAAIAHLDLVHGITWQDVRWLEESRFTLPDGVYVQAFGWSDGDVRMLRDVRPAAAEGVDL